MTQAAEHIQVGRSYTRARRYPWVVGKIQGWTIPLGPYTGTQLGVLIGGIFLLVNTYSMWSPLGPLALPLLLCPIVATWAVRHAKVEGRAPLRALAGYAALLTEPACGRIAGRPARDPRPRTLTGTVRITAPPDAPAISSPHAAGRVAEDTNPPLLDETAGAFWIPSPAQKVPGSPSPAGRSVRPPRRRVSAGGGFDADPGADSSGTGSRTAAPPASTAAHVRPRPEGQHPTRQTPPSPAARPRAAPPQPHPAARLAARPVPTALQALLARQGGQAGLDQEA